MKLPIRSTPPANAPSWTVRLQSCVLAASIALSGIEHPVAGAADLDGFAARIQANIQKGDFQERNAKFQQDLAGAADAVQQLDAEQLQKDTKEQLMKATQSTVAATGDAATGALLGTGQFFKGTTEAIKDASKADVKTALKETQAQYKENMMSGWNTLSADYLKGAEKNQKRAAEIISGAADGVVSGVAPVADTLIGKSAAELKKDVAAGSAKYAEVAGAIGDAVTNVDVAGLQEATTKELTKRAAGVAAGTQKNAADAAAKAAEVAARSTELATAAASRTVEQVSSGVTLLVAPDLDDKLASLQEAGQRQLEKSKAELARGYTDQSARTQAALSKAAAPDTSAVTDALGDVVSGVVDGVGRATSSTLTAAQQAAAAKQAEVEANIEKTDFNQRYAKAQEDAATLKRKIESKEIIDDVATTLAPLGNVPAALKEVVDAVPVDDIAAATGKGVSAIMESGKQVGKGVAKLQAPLVR